MPVKVAEKLQLWIAAAKPMTAAEIIAKARSFIGVINHYAMRTDHRTIPGSSDCSAYL